MRRAAFSEDSFLRWVRGRRGDRRGVLIDIGDDAACLQFSGGRCVVTTDILVEGVHFDADTSPNLIGRKAMAKNLSDIAAMGCLPRFALASIAFRSGMSRADARAIHRGMESMGARFQTEVVGGDVVVHDGPAAVNVVVLGEVRKGRAPVTRSGARVGDFVIVTGPLGGSRAGKHLRFTPRVREGLLLNRLGVHAMIDISDGLVRDLGHICDESGVGAVLEAAAIPVSAAARRLSDADGRAPLDHALNDGEDYELIATAAESDARKIIASGLGNVIGRIVLGDGVALRGNGRCRRLARGGYEHRS